MKGYVFITAAPGRSTDVVNALRRIRRPGDAGEPESPLGSGSWRSRAIRSESSPTAVVG